MRTQLYLTLFQDMAPIVSCQNLVKGIKLLFWGRIIQCYQNVFSQGGHLFKNGNLKLIKMFLKVTINENQIRF